jgi:hypothetical protein
VRFREIRVVLGCQLELLFRVHGVVLVGTPGWRRS